MATQILRRSWSSQNDQPECSSASKAWLASCFLPQLPLDPTVHSKYLKHDSFWTASASPTSSWLWKSILRSRSILQQGFCHLIQDGSLTKVWTDTWIPSLPSFRLHSKDSMTSQPSNLTVLSLIHPITQQWCLDKLKAIFDRPIIQAITLLQPTYSPIPNKFI